MGFRYPQPDDENGFEQLCLRLYRKLWNNESLKLYAKRGEKQDGVDIFDPLCIKPIRAVQCKHHEPTKKIPPSEIRSEVAKAEKSHFDIEHYVIATTAKKSREAQDTVAELNLRSNKKFTVDVHFWEEICQHASEMGRVIAELIVYGENILAASIETTRANAGIVMAGSSDDVVDGADVPFAAIELLLNERRLDLARYELEKLSEQGAATVQPRDHQYKLLRLHAKLSLESGEFEKASRLFLEAYATAPELDQAKQNQVLALSLVKDSEKAYELAKQYVTEGLTSPVMVLHLIDNAKSLEQLKEHSVLIESLIETDVDLNTALSHKYSQFGDYESATSAIQRALKLRPESPHVHLSAAFCAHRAAVNGDVCERQARLSIALQHYDAAEPRAREERFTNLLPEILVNRAAAKMLMHEKAGAAADYRAAVAVAARPALYVERVLGFFLQEQDFVSARELLDSLDRTTLEAQYLAAVTEYQSGAAKEKRACLDDMAALANQNWDRAVECRFHCVLWAIELGEHQLAESCVPHAFQEEHPFQAHVMLAWIRMTANDDQGARYEAAKALDESIRLAHPQELRLLAHIFINLRNDADALGLLEQVTTPNLLDDDMKALITCAQRLKRHDLLLRICQELRLANMRDEQLLKLEVQLLSNYAPKEALELAEELITKCSKPSYFVAAKNMLAVRLNELDKLSLDASLLPAPGDLLPDESSIVLLPYVTKGMYDEGLRFLYAQRRLYFEDEHAHGNYIYFFLTYGERTALQEPPLTVAIDSAVLLESDRSEQRWIIIENEQPVASRGEFTSRSDLAQSVLDRKVGDVVTLPGNPVQPQTVTVGQIQTKFVRAFQDSFHNFTTRFPGTSLLQQVHVGDKETFDPSAIVAGLQTRRDHVEKCITLYRDHPCSLFLFADRVGLNELEAIKSLAHHPEGLVKCCQISPKGFEIAVDEGLPSDSIVLSIAAIITLSLIDGWKYLDSRKTYFVSQLTSEVIDAWIHMAGNIKPKEHGVLNLEEDQLVYRETSDEERSARLDELRAIKAAVELHCQRVSSIAVAEMRPEKRTLYQQLLGLHNVEAISVAKDHNAILWSDDLVVGFIGKTDFGVSHFWTQLALRCNVEAGLLNAQDFDVISAKLVSWHYINTVWNAATIIAAGAQAEWDPQAWPLEQCFALIKKPELPIEGKMMIVLDFLHRLRRTNCIEIKQSPVIQAALDALADARAVRWLLSHIDQEFGVDIPSVLFIRAELEYWLRVR